MSTGFHIICLSFGLATFLAEAALADFPAGKSTTVEAAGIIESVEASPETATIPATGLEGPGNGATRAQRLAEIESTDPTAWLMRFGSVEKRPLLHSEP